MIYDKIENIEKYLGLSVHLDEAIRFLSSGKINELELGKTEIFGDDVFANVMEAHAKKEDEINFEIHKKYLDIQIDLIGTECIQIGLDPKEETKTFDPATDFGTIECNASASCVMGPGRFIFCMPEEPHKPGVAVSEDTYLKKCVIKVAM